MASMSLLQFHHQSVSLMPSFYYKSKHHRICCGVVVNGVDIIILRAKFQFGSSSSRRSCFLNWKSPRKLAEQSFFVRVNSSLGRSSSSSDVDDDNNKRVAVAVAAAAAAAAAGDGDDDVEIHQQQQQQQGDDTNVVDSRDLVTRFRGTISTTLNNNPAVLVVKQQLRTNFAVVLCIAIAFLVIAVREYVARKSRHNHHHGSVADLVKRGQLRSDRTRGISKPLKYDDPFNNPLVKVSKNSSTVEMCGKVYRLAPVTLTQEEQSDHQKRRSRAYQWKRPTMFLKEGDSLPPDVDPDTVRWIPANHPFATTVNDIDEDLAQNNVYQKHGVPFRIKAEHEALQKKLESLQGEQKLNKLVVDPNNARDFERPFKSSSKSHDRVDRRTTASQGDDPNTPKSDRDLDSSSTDAASSEELKKP